MYRHTRVAFIATTAVASALVLAAPAWAQRGQGRSGSQPPEPQRTEQRSGSQDRRDDNRRAGSAPVPVRQEAQRPQAQAQRPPAQQVQRQDQRGQQQVQRPPAQRPQVQAPVPARPGVGGRGAQQPYYGPPYNNGNGRGYGWGRGGGYGPAYNVRRPVFVQPYYYFRPRTTLSFGFHVGYGVSYPWNYWDPYGFYNYGFTIRPGYNVRSYYGSVGGVSFDVQPWGASVYIDGRYVGVAADFGPNQMPLTLPVGKHRVEFRCEGFRNAKFDIHVIAGQVIPYQGYLEYR